MMPKRTNYLLWAIVFLLISGVGVWWLLGNGNENKDKETVLEIPKDEMVVEEVMERPTYIPTLVATIAPIPTGVIQSFESNEDNFLITYASDRKMAKTPEGNGQRYSFYRNDSVFTVHVGSGWSWIYPQRIFDEKLLVAGKPTFVYETTGQKIVDIEYGTKKYTIQCVHNGVSKIMIECDNFIADFKLL